MNSSELTHLWAQNNNADKRAGNLYCVDGRLVFYSTCLGRFLKHKGKDYVLINDNSYSSRTGKHNSNRNRALHGHDIPKFHVGGLPRGTMLDFDSPGLQAYKWAMDQAAECLQKSVKARTSKAWLLEKAQEWMGEAQRTSDFFGLKKTIDRKALDKIAADKEKAAKEYAEEIAELRRIRKEREELETEWARQDLEKWVNHQPLEHGSGYFRNMPVKLRVEKGSIEERIDGDDKLEIVTSIGARIPYSAGKRTFEFYIKVHEKGWRRNGETFQIGAYQLDSANPQGLVAGCHRIDHEEIMRFAKQEGWIQSTETTENE